MNYTTIIDEWPYANSTSGIDNSTHIFHTQEEMHRDTHVRWAYWIVALLHVSMTWRSALQFSITLVKYCKNLQFRYFPIDRKLILLAILLMHVPIIPSINPSITERFHYLFNQSHSGSPCDQSSISSWVLGLIYRAYLTCNNILDSSLLKSKRWETSFSLGWRPSSRFRWQIVPEKVLMRSVIVF